MEHSEPPSPPDHPPPRFHVIAEIRVDKTHERIATICVDVRDSNQRIRFDFDPAFDEHSRTSRQTIARLIRMLNGCVCFEDPEGLVHLILDPQRQVLTNINYLVKKYSGGSARVFLVDYGSDKKG